jgi:transposase
VDKDKTKVLLDALRGGSDINTAAQYAGLNYQAVYRWVERGQRENEHIERGFLPREGEKDFLELWQAMRKARAEAVVRNVAQIQKAANQGDWKAAAWWLERTVPEFYSKKRYEGESEASSELPSAPSS